jgi:hypothetical protein
MGFDSGAVSALLLKVRIKCSFRAVIVRVSDILGVITGLTLLMLMR